MTGPAASRTEPPVISATDTEGPPPSGPDDCGRAMTADFYGRGPRWQLAARRARALSWLSLAWMSTEGALGLLAGLTAGSISLLGWALGSVIEGLTSVIVIWRFTGTRTRSESAEGRAQKAVAVSFFLLAPYLTIEGARDLLGGHSSDTTILGVAVTATSLVLMPALGIAKKRLGAILNSGATTGEGVQNLLCAAQAGAVLTGLALTATLGWNWIDPAIALLLAAWALREGREAWHGNDCC